MRQTLFLIGLEILAILGMFWDGPFIPIAVYYFLAVLRPQYFWIWALPPDVQWSNYPAIAAMAGVILYQIQMVPMSGKGQVRWPGIGAGHLFLMAFGFWIVVTYFTALNQNTAWPWLLEYLTIFVMFITALLAIRTLTQSWYLYLVAVIPLMYISWEVNSLYFLDGRLDIYRNGLGGLDNNGAGLTLAMGIPLAVGAWEVVRKWYRWVFIGSLPLILHAVLVTYSRGAMVALLAVTPIMILRSKRRWQFLGVVLMMAALVPFLAGNEIRERFFTLNDYTNDESAELRFESWKAAFRIANDYPIFGVGIRNSNALSYNYGADMVGRTIHSQFLQTLADAGYVGLGLYLLSLIAFFMGGIRTRWRLRGRGDPEAHRAVAMLNGLEGSMLVFCVGGAFLSLEVFELPYLLILVGLQVQVLVTRMIADEATAAVQPAVRSAFGLPLPATMPAARTIAVK